MRLSFVLAVVAALTASMSVSAETACAEYCLSTADCCPNYQCVETVSPIGASAELHVVDSDGTASKFAQLFLVMTPTHECNTLQPAGVQLVYHMPSMPPPENVSISSAFNVQLQKDVHFKCFSPFYESESDGGIHKGLNLLRHAVGVSFHTVEMDPITSGLTVLQVIQTTAQASALLLGYVASARKADSSCRSLLDELSSISGVLSTVMGIEKDGSLPDNFRLALSNLMAEDGPVVKLHIELSNLLPNEQEMRTMETMTRWTWPFKEREAGAILGKLKGYCVEITNILAIDTWITLTEVKLGVQEVSREVREVSREVQDVNRGIQESKVAQEAHAKVKEREKFLQWMNPVLCTEKHRTSCGQRNAATGRWIFQDNKYMVWNKSDSAFLWLNGQPGSGKTILASTVIDEIQGGGQAEPQTLAYFYCNFRDNETTNAAALLRQSKDDWVTKIRKPEQQELNAKACEPEQHDSNAEVDSLSLRELGQQQQELLNLAEDAQLRLFVTCRSEPVIQDAFHNLPTISLKDSAEQMKADICAHVTEQLKTQKRLSRLPDTLRKMILEKLVSLGPVSTGRNSALRKRYRYSGCPRQSSGWARLKHMIGLFADIQAKGRGYDQIAQNCLLWLAGALTPLTLDQLDEAMMIEVGKTSLNLDPPVPIVPWISWSHAQAYVKEYLISRRPNNILKSISDMHARICERLITYVLCDSMVGVCTKATDVAAGSAHAAGGRDDHPLLSYAVKALAHLCHVEDEDSRVIAALQRLHLEFLHNIEKHSLLESLYTSSTGQQSSVTSPSRLFIPIRFGNPWMAETFMKEYPGLLDMDVACGLGSPLIFAIASNPVFLGVLLKLGVDLNKPSSIQTDLYGQRDFASGSYTPISWAAAVGSQVAVEFLLSKTEVSLPDDILYTAVVSRQRSPEIVHKLCQRGAGVTFIDDSTLIHALLSRLSPKTCTSQWLPVVKALVGNLYVQDRTARTALHIALDNRLSDVVPHLLEQNARLTATATLCPTIWSWAINEEWFPKVQAATLAADQPHTRIWGKIIDATKKSKLVEFPGTVTADHEDGPICAVVVSIIGRNALALGFLHMLASPRVDLSRSKLSLQSNPKNDKLARLRFRFSPGPGQRVCSRLFDYHQGDTVTSRLRQLTQEKDSTGDSLFLRIFATQHYRILNDHDYALDIYRGPLH
ncbi:hypothetical protein EDB19DRAFT_1829369 [Suillus lakei]|nr:hypothetical protein EDB19DRAFT_1829369 [Suillus lakei]